MSTATVRFRSNTTRFVGVGAMAFAVAGLGAFAVEGDWRRLATYGGPLGLVGLVGLAGLWLPYVDISEGGLELRNVLRTVRVPWPAIQDVDGRYGLRLTTAYGRITAWAAPAPAGRDRMVGADSEAAAIVRQRMERLRAQGHLDNPRLESDRAHVTWHLPVIAAAIGLVVLTVVGPLLS